MPKELAHWHIAHDTIALLEPGIAADSITNFEAAFFIGAVAYDSPFYAIGLPERSLIKQTGDELHGMNGDSTLARFYRLMRETDNGDPSLELSFLAGALTHYAADVTIHPLVGFFCNGSPIHERRHRAFETCMDVYLTNSRKPYARVQNGLRGLLGDESVKQSKRLPNIVSKFYQSDESLDAELVLRMLSRHAAIRDRFNHRMLGAVARAYSLIGGESARILAATFYPARAKINRMLPGITEFFGSDIEFSHPRTGESVTDSLDGLMRTASRLAAKLISKLIDRSESSGSDPEDPGNMGFSLDAGCDVRKYPEEKHHGFADAIRSAGYYYE